VAATGGESGDHVVALDDGLVQGDPDGGSVRFLKIPYAAPRHVTRAR
jgi:hypothetical protein